MIVLGRGEACLAPAGAAQRTALPILLLEKNNIVVAILEGVRHVNKVAIDTLAD